MDKKKDNLITIKPHELECKRFWQFEPDYSSNGYVGVKESGEVCLFLCCGNVNAMKIKIKEAVKFMEDNL